jgi:hypothetical protein
MRLAILVVGLAQVLIVSALGLGDSVGLALPMQVKALLVVGSAGVTYMQAQLRAWGEAG